jgi:transcriptional regulator with XRE-family HTH domain
VAGTRWSEAIARLLAERGWTKRQLAQAASLRPNTVTNLLTHGRDTDTATLTRIAAALKVDIAELFLTREQSVVLHAHRESRVEQLKAMVVKELSETVTKIVAQELEKRGDFSPTDLETLRTEHTKAKPAAKRQRRSRT